MRKRKDKYALNKATGETHLLANVTGSCNLPDDAARFPSLNEVRRASGKQRLDRCAHCNGIAWNPKPDTPEQE